VAEHSFRTARKIHARVYGGPKWTVSPVYEGMLKEELDAASERHIQEALETLRRGRTCLIIAHRLSTIEKADRIIVLENGRIEALGRHEDLIRQQGVYTTLYRIQYRARETG